MGRGLVRFIVAVLISMTLLACEPSLDSPRLYVGDGTGGGVIYRDVAPNQSTTVGDLVVCVDRPGSVEIKRIELREGFGGLLLERFAAVPMSGSKGSIETHKLITKLVGDIATEPVILHGKCPDQTFDASTSGYYWLLLQYARPTARTAGNHGIVIWYESAGRGYSLFVNWQILLCDESDAITPECQF